MGFDHAAEGYEEEFKEFVEEIRGKKEIIEELKKLTIIPQFYLERLGELAYDTANFHSLREYISIREKVCGCLSILGTTDVKKKNEVGNTLTKFDRLFGPLIKEIFNIELHSGNDLLMSPGGTVVPKRDINPTLFGNNNLGGALMLVVNDPKADWRWCLTGDGGKIVAFCEWHKSDVNLTMERLRGYIDAGFDKGYNKTIFVPDYDNSNFLSLGPCKLNVDKSLNGGANLGVFAPADKITCYWELKTPIKLPADFVL